LRGFARTRGASRPARGEQCGRAEANWRFTFQEFRNAECPNDIQWSVFDIRDTRGDDDDDDDGTRRRDDDGDNGDDDDDDGDDDDDDDDGDGDARVIRAPGGAHARAGEARGGGDARCGDRTRDGAVRARGRGAAWGGGDARERWVRVEELWG